MGSQPTTARTTSQPIALEWAPFTVVAGTDEATLLAAADLVQTEFLSQQPGFIKRELLKGHNNQWVDIVYWNSRAAAEQAARKAATSPVCYQYFALMVGADHDDPNAGMLHFEQVKTY